MWVLSNLITAHIIKRVLLCTLDIIHERIIDHWFNLILHACLGPQCNSMDWETISLTASTNWASILIQYITKWTENGTHHSAIFLNSSCKKNKQTNKQWIGPCPWELYVFRLISTNNKCSFFFHASSSTCTESVHQSLAISVNCKHIGLYQIRAM